jgi:hypothetical protein
MSLQQNTLQDYNIKTANKSFQNVAKIKYLWDGDIYKLNLCLQRMESRCNLLKATIQLRICVVESLI